MQSAGNLQLGLVKNVLGQFSGSGQCIAGRWTFATITRLQKQVWTQSAAVETQAKRFFVSGRVQGVGFRFFAEQTATRLGVAGYVRNLFDGRVEVYAIGNSEQMDAMREALRRGPRMASVYRVDEQDAEIVQHHANFFSIEWR